MKSFVKGIHRHRAWMGMQALSKWLNSIGWKVPGRQALFGWTLFGYLGTNAFYYSLIGRRNQRNIKLKGGTWAWLQV